MLWLPAIIIFSPQLKTSSTRSPCSTVIQDEKALLLCENKTQCRNCYIASDRRLSKNAFQIITKTKLMFVLSTTFRQVIFANFLEMLSNLFDAAMGNNNNQICYWKFNVWTGMYSVLHSYQSSLNNFWTFWSELIIPTRSLKTGREVEEKDLLCSLNWGKAAVCNKNPACEGQGR